MLSQYPTIILLFPKQTPLFLFLSHSVFSSKTSKTAEGCCLFVFEQQKEHQKGFMKNYRPAESPRRKEQEKMMRYSPLERKTYSPAGGSFQARLGEYEGLAKKAKEQLKEFQNKRKLSPNNDKLQYPQDEKPPERSKIPQNKSENLQKPLQHSSSHKVFTRNQNEQFRTFKREEKKSGGDHPRYQKQQPPDMKLEIPRKRHYIDSNQYKKLHQKLDLIQHKITDMKRNLQRKKQEKQKNIQTRQKEHEEKKGLKELVTKVPEHSDLHTFNSNPYSPRHNIYYVSQLIRAYRDQQSLAREHLLASLNILKTLEKSKRLTEEEMTRIRVKLPKKKGYEDKKTIIFDLDQTLIHCNDTLNPPYDVKLPIKFPTGEIIEAGINIRPYSKDLLKNLSKFFEIILFTASHSCYANVVIDYLDPDQEYVHHRLFREHCYLSPEGMYVKDLRIINRDMKQMLLVDNAAYSYAYQLKNGIPIFPYYHGQVDFELKMLEDYIMKFVFCKDVRELNQNTFHLEQYRNYYGRPEKLVEDLYINK